MEADGRAGGGVGGVGGVGARGPQGWHQSWRGYLQQKPLLSGLFPYPDAGLSSLGCKADGRRKGDTGDI